MKLMKILSILILFFITSCVYNPQRPDIVESSSAQRVQTVQTAIVVDVKSIIISGDRETGAIAGGVIGAAAGQSITESDVESGIGGVIGGIVGSSVGSAIGNQITQKDAIELFLELESGKVVSIIQAKSQYEFQSGQSVRIVKSGGKSRVLPN